MNKVKRVRRFLKMFLVFLLVMLVGISQGQNIANIKMNNCEKFEKIFLGNFYKEYDIVDAKCKDITMDRIMEVSYNKSLFNYKVTDFRGNVLKSVTIDKNSEGQTLNMTI